MRALVTGAAGFVGRHMCEELAWRGYEVQRCDTSLNPGTGDVLLLDAGDRLRKIFDSAPRHYDLVVHAAARTPHRAAIDGDPAATIYNQLLDAYVFDWAVRSKQGRVLYLSSCAAADAEPDDYGLLKLTGERMAAQARRAGLPVTVVRPYSGYGEDQSDLFPFGAFVARAKAREDPFTIWGDGEQVRDFIHIDDVVAGALAVVDSGTEDPVGLCTGVGTAMFDLAYLICEQANYAPTFAPQSDKPAGVPRRVGDPTRMLEYYTPQVSLAEGIKRALA